MEPQLQFDGVPVWYGGQPAVASNISVGATVTFTPRVVGGQLTGWDMTVSPMTYQSSTVP